MREWFRAAGEAKGKILIGLGLLLVGLTVVASTIFIEWHSGHQVSQNVSAALKNSQAVDDGEPLISGAPIQIMVPSVGINVPVVRGYYYPATKSWTLSSHSAQWGVMTAQANNKSGDTFIYAHDLSTLFAPLVKVAPGDKATVMTADKHSFTYVYRTSVVTEPQDTSLFAYQGKPILVLQTCSGLWYQNRQLFIFDFEKVS